MSDKIIKNHKLLIYLSSIFSFQVFIGPIIVFFYTKYMGLSFSQYFFLDGLIFVLLALFEIPSGYIADKFGRKKVLLISQFFLVISMIILIVMPSFTGALISGFMLSLFSALSSGNSSALIFELFSKNNCINELEKTYAKSYSISIISSIIFATISSITFQYNMTIPIILDILFLLISLILNLFLLKDDLDYNPVHKNVKSIGFDKAELLNVTPIFIITALWFVITRVSFSYYQPIFETFNIEKYYGITFALFTVFCSLSSYIYSKIANKFSYKSTMILISILLALSFIGMSFNSIFFIITMIFLQQIMRGIYPTVSNIIKNLYINPTTKFRVTYLSYASFISSIFSGLMLGFSSLSLRYYSLLSTIQILSILLAILLFATIILHNILLKKEFLIFYK